MNPSLLFGILYNFLLAKIQFDLFITNNAFTYALSSSVAWTVSVSGCAVKLSRNNFLFFTSIGDSNDDFEGLCEDGCYKDIIEPYKVLQ